MWAHSTITRLFSFTLFLLATIAIGVPVALHAAIGDHISSTGYPTGGQIVLDGSDNYVSHGAFFGTINLGGSDLTSVNFLDGDQYLARFDSNGNHLWSMQITPVGNGSSGENVAVDPAGNVYVTGRLFVGTDIDYGGGVISGETVYIAKFDSNGNHVWSAGYGAGTPRSIVATNSNVIVAGYTSTGLDFGGGTIGNAGGNDIFVTSLTSAGVHAWSAGFGDASDQGAMSVDVDGSGNVLLVGTIFGTVDFGGGPFVANGLDLFLAKFSSAGAHSWSQVFDGLFSSGGGILASVDVAAGPSGEVAIAGQMSNGVDFGGGTITSNGFGDAYIALFNSSGVHQFSNVYGTSGFTDQARSVSMDSNGNVLMTGYFNGDTDFGGGTVLFNGDPLNFDTNIFVALYDGTGAHLFSNGYGQQAIVSRCAFDSVDNIIIDGSSSSFSTIDYGGGVITPSALYIAKLEGAGGPPTAIGDVPFETIALQAYPNPFNPTTTVSYVLDTPGVVSVDVFDVSGGFVESLVTSEWRVAGPHSATFSAQASGVYFLRVRAGALERTIKMIAIK